MAAVLRLLHRLRGRNIPRRLQDRQNPLETLSEEEVFNKFRFRPETVLYIVNMVAIFIEAPTKRSMPIPPLLQVLATLRFFATGSFYAVIGDTLNISKSTVCRCVRRVSTAIASLAARFVRFPSGQKAVEAKSKFFDIAVKNKSYVENNINAPTCKVVIGFCGDPRYLLRDAIKQCCMRFPNLVGCVDGTAIRITAPYENENDFVNRKGYHSMNVQMTCDADFRITSCVAKWPGAVHDSRMWRESNLGMKFENGQINGMILGDSAYPCKMYLMTPYNDPQKDCEILYNEALCKTRVTIEQTFGILKRRFSCMSTGLRVQPNMAKIYILACVVLHNIGIVCNDIIILEDRDFVLDNNVIVDIAYHGHNDGNAYRDHIAQTFFSN